jgi:hypothetical protein
MPWFKVYLKEPVFFYEIAIIRFFYGPIPDLLMTRSKYCFSMFSAASAASRLFPWRFPLKACF